MAVARKTEKEIPSEVYNTLLHLKENEGKREVIIMPITTYMSVLNRPKVVLSGQAYDGAPFHLLKVEEEEVEDALITEYCGNILNN